MNKRFDEIGIDEADELRSWEKETDEPLPMPVDEIIDWEDRGYIVDLTTGEVFPDPDQVQR